MQPVTHRYDPDTRLTTCCRRRLTQLPVADRVVTGPGPHTCQEGDAT